MSPASKFWLGVIILSFLLISIKLPIVFFIILIFYLIASFVSYFSIIPEIEELLQRQKQYEEEQIRSKNDKWFVTYYEDKSKEIEKNCFYLRLNIIYWIAIAVESFNNFLNNKFSKNG